MLCVWFCSFTKCHQSDVSTPRREIWLKRQVNEEIHVVQYNAYCTTSEETVDQLELVFMTTRLLMFTLKVDHFSRRKNESTKFCTRATVINLVNCDTLSERSVKRLVMWSESDACDVKLPDASDECVTNVNAAIFLNRKGKTAASRNSWPTAVIRQLPEVGSWRETIRVMWGMKITELTSGTSTRGHGEKTVRLQSIF